MDVGAIASRALVCVIFIVHTMHDSRYYLKMGSPCAYGCQAERHMQGEVSSAAPCAFNGQHVPAKADLNGNQRGKCPMKKSAGRL